MDEPPRYFSLGLETRSSKSTSLQTNLIYFTKSTSISRFALFDSSKIKIETALSVIPTSPTTSLPREIGEPPMFVTLWMTFIFFRW